MADISDIDEAACSISSNGSSHTDLPIEVYNDLLCPICLEFFKHPIILPCSHVLCRSPCAENLFDFNFIRCPVCRENCYVSGGIGSLPRVIPLESIIEKYRLERRKVIQNARKAQKKATHQSNNACAQKAQSNTVCAHKVQGSVAQRTQDDSVTSCSRHGSESSVYCQVCERCVCDACGDGDHVTSHVTNSVEDATLLAKEKLVHSLEQMTISQIKVLTSLEQQRQRLKDMEQIVHRKSEETNMQFDSLLAEVEHKRSLFLADLEQEERMRRSEIDDVIDILEKSSASSQSLAQYTKDVLDKDNASILQVTHALNEQLLGSVLDCEACQGHPDDLHVDPLAAKVVDLRKEQALLRDIHYLNPPSTPTIDLGRCARGQTTVALFIVPPRHSDVVDSYVIRYCSEEQKARRIEEALTLDHPTSNGTGDHHGWTTTQNHPTPHPYRLHLCESPFSSSSSPSPSSSPAPVLVVLLERLHSGTPYFFCLGAANRAGGSGGTSEAVQCVTLTALHSVVPVPVILEAMCHTYPTSIRVYTPSPHDVAPEQSISHFLLYRPRDRKCLWRCLALCGRVEERVFGLEPGVQYELVVMAKNPRGECQISDKVVLETDSDTLT
ncbi:hypothetical protein ACOMHN_017589 [Nucella lapillus]